MAPKNKTVAVLQGELKAKNAELKKLQDEMKKVQKDLQNADKAKQEALNQEKETSNVAETAEDVENPKKDDDDKSKPKSQDKEKHKKKRSRDSSSSSEDEEKRGKWVCRTMRMLHEKLWAGKNAGAGLIIRGEKSMKVVDPTFLNFLARPEDMLAGESNLCLHHPLS